MARKSRSLSLASSLSVLLSHAVIQPDGKGNQCIKRVQFIFHCKLILHLLIESIQEHFLVHLLIPPRLWGQDMGLYRILLHTARPLAEGKPALGSLLPLNGVVKNISKFCCEGREREDHRAGSLSHMAFAQARISPQKAPRYRLPWLCQWHRC